MREAHFWLTNNLLLPSKSQHVQNNFITYFGEEEHLLLTKIMRQNNVSIEQVLRCGKARITVTGNSIKANLNTAIAFLEVEDMLLKIQREFEEEEAKVLLYEGESVSFRRTVPAAHAHFSVSDFNHERLQIVKVQKLSSVALLLSFKLTLVSEGVTSWWSL